MKYQWLLLLYIPTVYGMFISLISPALGLGFLGGGFITAMGLRIIAETKLNGHNDEY